MNLSKTLFISLLALTFSFVGCKSTEVSKKENEKIPVMITKGMTSAQLQQLIGKPKRIRTVEDPAGKTEIWEYSHTEKTATRLAQTGQTMTPYIDPITGRQSVVIDETLTPQTETTTEILEILIQNGLVLAWKQEKETNSRYVN